VREGGAGKRGKARVVLRYVGDRGRCSARRAVNGVARQNYMCLPSNRGGREPALGNGGVVVRVWNQMAVGRCGKCGQARVWEVGGKVKGQTQVWWQEGRQTWQSR